MKSFWKAGLLLGLVASFFSACDKNGKEPEEPVKTPVINVTPIEHAILPSGAQVLLSYSITDKPEGDLLPTASADVEWVHSFDVRENIIAFDVDPNDSERGSEPREAKVTVKFEGAEDVVVSVRQLSMDVLSFEITEVALTPSTAKFSCHPSDPEATYVFRIVSESDFNEFPDDAAYIADDVEYFQRPGWDGTPGNIENFLHKDDYEEEFTVTSTKPHYVYAYGLNADATVTSALFKVSFTVPERPVLEISELAEALPVEGGEFEVTWSVSNPVEGGVPEITPLVNCDWIHDFKVDGNKIKFTVDANDAEPGSDPRTGGFNVSYPEAYNAYVSVTQNAPEEVAKLSFTLEVTDRNYYYVRVKCTPSDPSATYVLRSESVSDYNGYGSDEALIKSDIEYFNRPDMWNGGNHKISEYLKSGEQTESFDFNTSAPHYVYAYGLNADGTVTSSVFKIETSLLVRPEIVLDDMYPEIDPKGGSYSVAYTIKNPDGDRLPQVETEWGLSWAHDFEVSADKITFVVDKNTTGAERSSWFRVVYSGAYDKTVQLIQEAATADPLVFEFTDFDDKPVEDISKYTGGSVYLNVKATDPERQGFLFGTVKKDEFDSYASLQEFVDEVVFKASHYGFFDSYISVEENVNGDYYKGEYYKLQYLRSYETVVYAIGVKADDDNETTILTTDLVYTVLPAVQGGF